MSRTHDYYREEDQERYDLDQQYQEEKWYHEQMELLKEEEISEIPSTEEDLFRQMLEDERNENL